MSNASRGEVRKSNNGPALENASRRQSSPYWLGRAALFGAGVLTAWAAPKVLGAITRWSGSRDLFDAGIEAIDRRRRWHTLPVPLGAVSLIGLRDRLRTDNLYDTGRLADEESAPPTPPADGSHLVSRTADGTYNDLGAPAMGSADTRFGRNAPIHATYREQATLLKPSPRVVSLELMTRNTFQPASTLNLLAAAWIQFMVRDWFSHGRGDKQSPWLIPLAEHDDWYENPMKIVRTAEDPTRTATERNLPPTYINSETHWWDASQLYGSTQAFQSAIRTGTRGQVGLMTDGFAGPTSGALVQQPGLAGWWVGQELMFTLFAREHNAICAHLAGEYPDWSDEQLFQHARLVNAALLAKIHTLEWTTAILGHPVLQIAMRTNWWGVLGEHIHRLLGRVSDNELLSGIMGGKPDHFGVPFSMTEEFVAVYRMHPLIPDDLVFRSARGNALLGELDFAETAGLKSQAVADRFGMRDLLYSFGRMHPGAIVLHNYPKSLQRFTRPNGVTVDLASTDVLRSRELGVPRYTAFRRMLRLSVPRSFQELTPNQEWAEQIRSVYDNDIEQVDMMVGLYAEKFPKGFGFSDTAFRIFLLMASRRLNSDRFFTTDFTPAVYSPAGMKWIEDNTMRTVLLRHHPELTPALYGVRNAFFPWRPTGA